MNNYGGMFILLGMLGIIKELYGELCVEENTFVVGGASGGMGF